MKRFSKYLSIVILVCLSLISILIILFYFNMARSRPQVDGVLQLKGLQRPVVVKRDSLGIPLIEAGNLRDAVFAIGFLHAQERYFQMDLMRRKAAGELAELFGASAVEGDKTARIHRFRARAKLFVDQQSAEQKDILREYTAGVNAGLRALKGAPFEYGLLFLAPQPWQEEDSLLVNMAMYKLLQENKGPHPETVRQKLTLQYGKQFADFIQASRSEWDAPMQEGEAKLVQELPPRLMAPQTVSSADPALPRPRIAEVPGGGENIIGSNSWAVSGRKTFDGRAMLANDMHLPLQQPNTFYHLTIKSADLDHLVAGVSIPGMPALVAGSNGHIAWGLTNTNGDWSDLVRIGKEHLAAETKIVRETIRVKGGKPVILEVRESRWGPIVDDDAQAAYALDWVAHHVEGNNLGLFPLLRVTSIDSALKVAAAAGMAQMNIVFADERGNVAWTVAGRIPRRTGFAGNVPVAWTNGVGWTGWLGAADYPVLTSDDRRDFVWSANNRVVSGGDWQKIGVGAQFALGVRAGRIEERLAASSRVSEKDMHALQLDDVALLMKRWHHLIGEVIAGMDDSPQKHELADVMARWDGKAAAGSAAYRVMRRFREEVAADVMPRILADLLKKDPTLQWYTVAPQWETPLWQIVSQRPAAALPAGERDWQAYLRGILLDKVYKPYKDLYKGDLQQATWGAINVAKIRHPLSGAIPLLGAVLDMPKASMNGDSNVVLAQFESFGPAMRLVVAPGHEADGILTMPAGEAGNPLSPYYRGGHKEWQKGLPLPLLAGEARYVLRLEPAVPAH